MKRFVRAIVAAAVTGPLLASAGLAGAQPPPPPVAQGQGQARGPDLPTLLHLRPDQMAAYHAVETAARDSPTLVAELRAKAQRLPSETFLQRLDFQGEVLNMQVSREHRILDAQRKFYIQLTPAQQRTLDQVTAPHPQ